MTKQMDADAALELAIALTAPNWPTTIASDRSGHAFQPVPVSKADVMSELAYQGRGGVTMRVGSRALSVR